MTGPAYCVCSTCGDWQRIVRELETTVADLETALDEAVGIIYTQTVAHQKYAATMKSRTTAVGAE